MEPNRFNRRRFLQASAAAVMGPHIRTSSAAGALAVGFWDHSVPRANDVLATLCNEWAAKEKIDLKIDFLSVQGNKLLLTIAAEAHARTGHDVLALPTWYATSQAKYLEPVDDIVEPLIKAHGNVSSVFEYLGKQDGHWLAVPATPGSQLKPPCARIDFFKQYVGLDLTKMYPPSAPPDKLLADNWTWDTFLVAAQKCHKGGHPFGLGLGQTTDSVDWAGALFASFGAELVDAKGNITVNSDPVKQGLEYMKKIVPFLPPDIFAWDDAANNKYLISGKGALIMNPPSAWAVAKRDSPKVAEQLWTFPTPRGPKGRYQPGLPFFWGIWKFSKNKSAAKSLLTYLSQRSVVQALVAAGGGYDIPAFSGLRDFKTWAEEGPPKGTLFHYPSTTDQVVWIAAAPAPPAIATQIYSQATLTKMIARYTQRAESLDKVIEWASSELESFARQ